MAGNNTTPTPSPPVECFNGCPSKQEAIFLASFVCFVLVIVALAFCHISRFSRPNWQNRRLSASASAPAAAAAAAAAASAIATRGGNGLNPEVLLSLPVFVYSAVVQEGRLECAVCLAEFKEGEKCRLLPRCKHRFHAECVDAWFNSHSTCPLCRAAVYEAHEGTDSAV